MIVRRLLQGFGLLATLSATVAAQQGRQLFEWSGRVDREIQIAVRGRDSWLRNARLDENRGRTRIENALPQQDGEVSVSVLNGRGDADVIEQPSARNDYTALIRVRDRGAGDDRYRIQAYWRPLYTGNSRNSRNGVYDRNSGTYDRGTDTRARDNSGVWGRTPNQYQNTIHWSGDVDDVLEIRLSGDRADYRTISGRDPRSVQSNVANVTLPRRDLQLRINQNQGRGRVEIVQQPTTWNGYTAVLRVIDRDGGYGFYDFDVSW